MRKIIILILFLFFVSLAVGQPNQPVCCTRPTGDTTIPYDYKWSCGSCEEGWTSTSSNECFRLNLTPRICFPSGSPPGSEPEPAEEFPKPGQVDVTWTVATLSVCPPSILGSDPCTYPSLIDLIQRINELLLTIAPPTLVILLIIGGLMYLLTPFAVEKYIQSGHRYVKYAIFGFIILLLTTLIFSIISALLGGPSP